MIKRRDFIKLCTGCALSGLYGSTRAAGAGTPAPAQRDYERVRLVDPKGDPVRPADLDVGENYIFHYPYVTTPCLLINLGQQTDDDVELHTDGGSYRWGGGVGPGHSLVSFSAICTHRLSYPARQASFISYRHDAVHFVDSNGKAVEQARVILCCSQKSAYDPKHGARVLGGPAPEPLAAINLQHDASEDALYATGTIGDEMFDRFFEAFSFRLTLDYETMDVRKPVQDTTTVMPLAQWTQNQVICG